MRTKVTDDENHSSSHHHDGSNLDARTKCTDDDEKRPFQFLPYSPSYEGSNSSASREGEAYIVIQQLLLASTARNFGATSQFVLVEPV